MAKVAVLGCGLMGAGIVEVCLRTGHETVVREVNQEFLPAFREKGLVLSGMSPDKKFVEMVELPDHPWFLGCQFHPEFKSKPFAPHPLFAGFVKAARDHRDASQRAPSAEVKKLPLGKNA